MNLLRHVNNYGGASTEWDMQKAVSDLMADVEIDRIPPRIYREVSIPEIGRISDIIVMVTDNKIINIECKLVNYTEVIRQAEDHLRWADYSYVCLHTVALLPPYVVRNLIDKGIGLMLWSEVNGLVDVVGAGHNTYKAGIKDKAIREGVIKRLKKLDAVKTAEKEIQFKLTY